MEGNKKPWMIRSISQKNVLSTDGVSRFTKSKNPNNDVVVVTKNVCPKCSKKASKKTKQSSNTQTTPDLENTDSPECKAFLFGSFIKNHIEDATVMIELLDALQCINPFIRVFAREELVQWMSNHVSTWTRQKTQDALVMDGDGNCYVYSHSDLFNEIYPYTSVHYPNMSTDDMVFINNKSYLRMDMDTLKKMISVVGKMYFDRIWKQVIHENPTDEASKIYASKFFIKIDKLVEPHQVHVKLRPAVPAYPKGELMREYLKTMLYLTDEQLETLN